MNIKKGTTTGVAAVDALSPRRCKNIVAGCTQKRAQAAFQAYARWLRRQERTEHPAGKFDKAGRWEPSTSEDCDGFTSHTRTPSRAWPYSYLLAARSLEHCEALSDADHADVLMLRRAGLFDGLDADTSDADAKARAQAAWTALQVRAGLLQVAVVEQVAVAGTTAANDDALTSQTA